MTDNLIRDVVTLASGQWLNILNNLCGEIHYKNAQPCPSCGGHDRFTFDDLVGRGTYVCRGCGSGDGLSLVAKVHSVNAREAALLIAPYVGVSVGQFVDTAAIERSRRKTEQAKEQEAAKLAAKQAKAATRAIAIVKNCIPALASNIYLNAKQVQPFSTFELTKAVHLYGDYIMSKGSLVVPIFNPTLSGLQFVQPNSEKHILAGSKVKGGFYPLSGKDSNQIYIGEGFATCSAVAECLPNALVLCAFSAGNLINVALAIRPSRPKVDIIIIADNDESGTGEREAIKAAMAVNGSYVMPPAEAA
ncbi:toprim domain-containing protein [Shewanella sp. SR44-4]|jgi:putative DNA primase/helicase|uniref:primase-helicase zinc-binding domain-containing protein n=1 Tax=Shewanella sp. SR44-4 TaxID=2760935 RepID=UPI001601D079|nr:primase-helicase zinc-binding domain-containing protein [Shewanella sp. SR44-4]MBB1363811.1 toprim domain-containing protein [Shewanella sp. SR44-4]